MTNHDPDQEKTIIGVPYEGLRQNRELCLEQPELEGTQELAMQKREFKIRLADNAGKRSSASMLINKMYSWRGYSATSSLDENPNRVTIVASDGDMTIGTISINFDSELGLLVDQLYKDVIDPLRIEGQRLCEFIKLAVDGEVKSKKVLAALFHIAVIYAREVFQYSHIVIEVNPRHVKFYERMLGFKIIGPERNNPRVNAPAVLLSVSLDYIHDEVLRVGGRPELAGGERSIYPYFFSPAEAEGIAGRLFSIN